jgi:hypothetical protein
MKWQPLPTQPKPVPTHPFVQNNLEINSDLKSAKDTPPVHKNLTISVADPVSWISNQRSKRPRIWIRIKEFKYF